MISDDQVKLETQYEESIESNVERGVIHPRLIRWWNEDKNNDEPVKSGTVSKHRYKLCKTCEHFSSQLKLCGVCKCFMPLKVQLKKSKCPKGIWND